MYVGSVSQNKRGFFCLLSMLYYLIGKNLNFLKGLLLLKMLSHGSSKIIYSIMWCLSLKVKVKKEYKIFYKVFCFLFQCNWHLWTLPVSENDFSVWILGVRFWSVGPMLFQSSVIFTSIASFVFSSPLGIYLRCWLTLLRKLSIQEKNGGSGIIKLLLQCIKLYYQGNSFRQST